jgi:hypothetical protein
MTYDVVVALMGRGKVALLAVEALLEMLGELGLTSARHVTLRTGDGERADFRMRVELGLALEDALAAHAPEVIAIQVAV